MTAHLVPGTGALGGVVVLDLSRVLAGPYAAQMLADLGATVVKIENPRDPDVSRGFPPYLSDGDEEFSGYYAQYNRGKLGVGLDLAAPGGVEALIDLVRSADILVENFRPGTMDKLGVGYEVLRAVNPRLVYVAVSGYGQTGSRSRRPAFDNTAQAAGGLWSMNGYPDRPPVRVGVTIGDLSATMFAVVGTLAALRHAERTGEGQLVDVAQVDSVLALTETAVVEYTVRGVEAAPAGNEHAWVRPYELFDCADGQVFFGAYTDKLWRASCVLFGATEIADDPEIDTMRKRFDPEVYARRVKPLVSAWLAPHTKAELEEMAGDVIPLTAVKTIGEVVDDPGTAERDMIVEADYGSLGTLRMFGQPIKLSATPATPGRVANRFAEHSDVVLTALAGYDAERLAALRASGALS
ncbi:CoA:oxalate CoA-transferase [Microbacterium sp. ru370.1]|uniref:CaiB/BaiF CoA transferase family protein n=1 Tax=unclassified Microbacterium TaxID=2609290 RepID=UPI000887E014|nr:MULTISPECIES: CoA transferase [unclassified Microbacterium]SDO25604.1 CoA:oxalate CoA-transferase [Microbacterium sp. ru370.1]SIT73801.1 CoA:oxalate CoA-transferase [Microbacterium sp. RU1D]